MIDPLRAPERDDQFFTALRNGHSVRAACEAAGYTRASAYRWRKENEVFARAWEEAQAIAADLLEEEADRRGRDGYDEPIFYHGELRGVRRRFSDGLLAARLKALKPDQYRDRMPSLTAVQQPGNAVLVRDLQLEDLVLRLAAEGRLSPAELPDGLRARALQRVEASDPSQGDPASLRSGNSMPL